MIRKKAIQSCVGIGLAVILFFCAGLKIPVLDSKTDAYFQQAMTKAGLAYATCRIINASVSVVKDSSLELEPAGVGVSLAVGQVLDPIDDMTERVSDILVMAITSLGVQKLSYEIGVSLVPQMFSMVLLFLSILIWFDNDRIKSLHKTFVRVLIFIAVFRFCLPVSSLVNDFVHKNYFEAQISQAKDGLVVGSKGIEQLSEFSLPQIDGFIKTIENSAGFVKQKAIAFKHALESAMNNIESIIDNLLKLAFLYVGVFLIQIILLPLASFWILVKLVNSLFVLQTPLHVS
ncbi:MAG: hypothetical protein KKE62_19560 [Proteobacteria bacterium]|nr:hypothetical protein [Pseudomonadota bacterium]MBU1390011.1 hypothetical protein [Pseudomonadota bacterium]MBU1545038.1 hypothetical protein [Pseudomonadota bacterium]MBU2480358.1 hypothetical protein [Pseudomonadota bacterium]